MILTLKEQSLRKKGCCIGLKKGLKYLIPFIIFSSRRGLEGEKRKVRIKSSSKTEGEKEEETQSGEQSEKAAEKSTEPEKSEESAEKKIVKISHQPGLKRRKNQLKKRQNKLMSKFSPKQKKTSSVFQLKNSPTAVFSLFN